MIGPRLSILLVACVAALPAPPTDATQWGVWELSLSGPSTADVGNPFADVSFGAEFTLSSTSSGSTSNVADTQKLTAAGFYDGDGTYIVRFSPPLPGIWRYRTTASANAVAQLAGRSGTIDVAAALPPNHGPVRSRGYEFVHADGTPHFSTGTTCYQWASMPLATQNQTLSTLLAGRGDGGEPSVFNKIRMTVFPKWYVYNHHNPVEVGAPFEILPDSEAANATSWGCMGAGCPHLDGSFDLRRFNVSFWRNYESLVRRLDDAGIVADIIVFHPYDNGHWGFDCLGGRDGKNYNTTNDDFYLRYLGARLSAFKNVWWAMANEWNFCDCKSFNATGDNGPYTPVWDHLFHTLTSADPYGRMMSIHNGNLLYNHSQPWITHVSLQGHIDTTAGLRVQYGKPVVWDEVKYEGNITDAWGALSGVEEADRFWMGASKGVYVGHSDTVLDWRLDAHDDAQPLWWAKGGELRGQSPPRIGWFRQQYVAGDPAVGRPPVVGATGVPSSLANSNSEYAGVLTAPDGSQSALRFTRPGAWDVPLPVVPAPAPEGLCDLQEGVNCEDQNIRKVGTIYHKDDCCAACQSDPSCRAWTWNRGYEFQTCWIKTGCDKRTAGDPNIVSGVGTPAPGPAPPPAAGNAYDVWHLDFWEMKATLLATVSGKNSTTVETSEVPFYVQIVRRQAVTV